MKPYTEEELRIQGEAIKNLDSWSLELRRKLESGKVHERVWEETEFGAQTKVGQGHLKVYKKSPWGYPGIIYVSSMGANSDDSYGGLLPGVNFDEALKLVFGDYLRYVK